MGTLLKSLTVLFVSPVCRSNTTFTLSLQTSKNQIKVDLVDENFTELKGEIAGPPDTPYEGEQHVWFRHRFCLTFMHGCTVLEGTDVSMTAWHLLFHTQSHS